MIYIIEIDNATTERDLNDFINANAKIVDILTGVFSGRQAHPFSGRQAHWGWGSQAHMPCIDILTGVFSGRQAHAVFPHKSGPHSMGCAKHRVWEGTAGGISRFQCLAAAAHQGMLCTLLYIPFRLPTCPSASLPGLNAGSVVLLLASS